MDLIRKRQASNIRARMSCGGLLTAYCLFALFSSVPLPTSGHGETARAQIVATLPASDTLQRLQTAKTAKWWQQHQEIAFLHEKWWQRHTPVIAATSPASLPVKPITPTRKAAEPAIKSAQKPAMAPIDTASSAKALAKPLQGSMAAVKLAETDSVSKLAAKSSATTAIGTQTSHALLKPLKFAPIEPPVKISLASLSSRAVTAPGILRSPSKSDFEQHLPAFIKKAFNAYNTRATTPPKAAHCVADKIAGWSGIKLLPQHVEMLKKTRSPAPEISAGLATRLELKGFTPGSPVFMRIFKDKSELEVWLKKGERYALYHTYKICRWSGSFGPKLYEGDKQSPEGFYTVNRQLFMRPSWKWKGSFSLGYPNAYDKLHGRTGSLILVHGGCTSAGCFAMTDPVLQEVRELARLARDAGQKKFSVHVYPFKLTTANLVRHKGSPWRPFWDNLKEGYDLFEKTGLPPRVRVCDKRYVFARQGVDRAGTGWSGKGCYGLAAYIPGWKPASRYATKNLGKRTRRAARRARRASVRPRCNLNRASCRKFVALKRKKSAKRRKSARRTRLSKKRRATMRRARAIGRKHKNKRYKSTGGNS